LGIPRQGMSTEIKKQPVITIFHGEETMRGRKVYGVSLFTCVLVCAMVQTAFSADPAGKVGRAFEIAATGLAEWMPRLEYNSLDDEFLVLWHASGPREEGGEELYSFHGRRVSTGGKLLGDQFTPIEYLGTRIGILPTPVFNPYKNEYMVAYNQGREVSNIDTLATIINNLGGIELDPVAMSIDPANQMHPAIVFNTNKREYFIAYNDSRDGDANIFGIILGEDGSIVQPEFRVNGAAGGQINPHACYNPKDDTYLVNWEDFRNVDDWMANSDMYGVLLKGNGEVLVNDIPMRDDFGTDDEGDQRHNNIVYNPDRNEFLVSWSDNGRPSLRNGGAVGRIVNADGSLGDGEIIIADEAGFQMFPHIEYIEERQMYFAVWEDGRNNDNPDTIYWRDADNWDVYAGWLDASGNKVGDDIPVCTGEGIQRYSSVAYSPQADTFLIAWQDVVEESGWSEGGEQHVTEEGGNIMASIYDASPANPCLIARVVQDEHVLGVLRDFRDNVLSATPAGREITRRYYEWSPLLVKMLEEDNALRNLVEEMVAGMLPLIDSK